MGFYQLRRVTNIATTAQSYVKAAIALSITLLTLQLLMTVLAPVSNAAIAPENCFTFEPETGTITSYSNAPECPRNLDIPALINDNEVIRIGESAFNSNGLTAVTFPNTIIEIERYAFSNNQLTSLALPESLTVIRFQSFATNQLRSVTIPDSITTIESESFTANQLTSLEIPASVTSVGSDGAAFTANYLKTVIIKGNPVLGAYEFSYNGISDRDPDGSDMYDATLYRDNAEFVRIYASDPNFIASNQDRIDVSDIYNQEGTEIIEKTVIGGYLINPAFLQVSYVNSANTELSAQLRLVGPDATMKDYSVAAALNKITMSETDYTATFSNPDTYYRIGQMINPTLPIIDGYIIPESRMITLASAENQVAFIYLTQAEVDAGAIINPDGTVSVPNTGLQAIMQSPLFVMFAGLSAMLALLALHSRRKVSIKN